MKDLDYVSIVNIHIHLYLIIDKTDGFIEEKSGNKYLIFASTDKNKEVLTKYTEFWDKIKYLIKTGSYRIINQVNMEKISQKSILIQMIICL